MRYFPDAKTAVDKSAGTRIPDEDEGVRENNTY